jgi:hypothetical protein
MMALTGSLAEQLSEALGDAYRRRPELRRMVRYKLDRNLDAISGAGGLEDTIFDLVDRADAEGWVDRLVAAALEDKAGNSKLHEFYEKGWLALAAPSRESLESLIKPKNKFFDFEPWVQHLIEIGPRVCRIAIDASQHTVYGTGFLVGPDLVLTNYHVVESVILGEQGRTTARGECVTTGDVQFLFDYKTLPDGSTVNPGVRYLLNGSTLTNWLVHASPPSPLDDKPRPGAVPEPDQLDFALLRLADSPGDMRGWIDLPCEPPELTPGMAWFILQHPRSKPLKLAIDTDGVIAVNANGTRVTYTTNTEGGSSGSPCFNSDWILAGLHHRGDPDFGHTSNEGIPIAAIVSAFGKPGIPKNRDSV